MVAHKFASVNGLEIRDVLEQAQKLTEHGYELVTAYGVSEKTSGIISIRHFYVFKKDASKES